MTFVHDASRVVAGEYNDETKSLVSRILSKLGNGSKGRTNIVEHGIGIGDAKPIHHVPRRWPLVKSNEPENIVKNMEGYGVINLSTTT